VPSNDNDDDNDNNDNNKYTLIQFANNASLALSCLRGRIDGLMNKAAAVWVAAANPNN
jgi:hypothetical protein